MADIKIDKNCEILKKLNAIEDEVFLCGIPCDAILKGGHDDRVTEALAEAQATQNKLESKIQELTSANTTAKEDINNLTKLKEENLARIKELNQQQVTLKEEHDKALKKLMETEGINEDQQNEILKLQGELEGLTKQLEEKERELQAKKKQLGDQEKETATALADRDMFQEQMIAHEAEFKRIEAEKVRLLAKISELEGAVEKLEESYSDKIKELQLLISQLSLKNNEQAEKIIALEKLLDNNKLEQKRLEDRNKEMQQSLEELQTTYKTFCSKQIDNMLNKIFNHKPDDPNCISLNKYIGLLCNKQSTDEMIEDYYTKEKQRRLLLNKVKDSDEFETEIEKEIKIERNKCLESLKRDREFLKKFVADLEKDIKTDSGAAGESK